MKSKFFKQLLAIILALVLTIVALPIAATPANAAAYTGIMRQTESQWLNYSFNGGTLYATGCGIFSLANAVGYLTGEKMDVVEIARWAHNNGMYNVTGADGIYRTSFYPRASARYGPTYGFTIDCSSDGGGYWSGVSDARLKVHLENGGTAVIHVYNHFMCLVDYDRSSNKFHLYDCAPRDRRGTLANGGDLWFTEAQLSSGYTDVDWYCLVSGGKDEEKPIISNVTYSEVSAAGYTISCTVTDNKAVSKVAFPTWTVKNAQDDLKADWMNTQQGTKNGNTYTFRVNASDHNNETGAYVTHIYAQDRKGNVAKLSLDSVEVRNDTNKPVISDVVYSNVSAKGYTISCKVTDDWGVNKVQFPTWTVKNEQDDINGWTGGTKDGDIYTFRVNASDHNNEGGHYATHIYATDCAGNQSSLALPTVEVRNDTQKPEIYDAKVSDVTAAGYTVTCKVKDDWGINSVAFPTWSIANGQDDLAEMFMETQKGTNIDGTYTFYVKASDHNNEGGVYTTHIYASDCAGNTTSISIGEVELKDPVIEITLNDGSQYISGGDYVSNVEIGTSADAFLAEFENEDLEVLDLEGNVLTGTSTIGTGATVNLYADGKLVDTVNVVVQGDVDGNGVVDSTDYMRIKALFLIGFNMNRLELLAADIDNSDSVDSTDYLRIKTLFLNNFRMI